MTKITVKPLVKKKGILLTFLILFSLIISGQEPSRRHWDKSYIQVNYDAKDAAILITFVFYDYLFDKWWIHGFLDHANFFYSMDEKNDIKLMDCKTTFQNDYTVRWAEITMANKIKETDLQFNDSYLPPSGTKWGNDKITQVVSANTIGNKATLTIKWFLKGAYVGVKTISIDAMWVVKPGGPFFCPTPDYAFDMISELVYKVPYPTNQAMKSSIETDTEQNDGNEQDLRLQPENRAVKLVKEEDGVIIKGDISGEIINVYTMTGAKIQSIVVNNDIVKVKLAANQIYIVHVGQARYKIAL